MKSKLIAAIEESETNNIVELINFELSKQSPIIEAIENDAQNELVTFIYCGDCNTHSVNVYSPLIGVFPHKMSRLKNTNYFYYTLVVPNNIRVSYAYLPNDSENYDEITNKEQRMQKFTHMWGKLTPDSFNRRQINLKNAIDIGYDSPRVRITNSILEMPFAPTNYWSQKRQSIQNIVLEKFNIKSKILSSQRDYWVCLPREYDKNKKYPLLIVFDGQLYCDSGISLTTIIDNLVYENKIPPIITVFIDSIGFYQRAEDLKCSKLFLEFITHEFFADINLKYSISKNRSDHILMGASLGGLFSLYSSLQHPDLFGKVYSQSGVDKILSPIIHADSGYPLKIYLDVGSLENTVPFIEMREMLLSAGHNVLYNVFPGAHDLVCWETAIPNALIYLLKEDN